MTDIQYNPSYILSVITINFNNVAGLTETLESVASQSCQAFQFLIIDGGSTDGSVDVIQNYCRKIDYWVSEKDAGIYDAMNKGIERSTGDYCIFINSGDLLHHKNTLEKLLETLDGTELIYGDLLHCYGNRKIKVIYPSKLDRYYFYRNALPHPATAAKRSLLRKTNSLNATHKIVSDWEFFILAVIKYKCSYKQIDLIISDFDLQGISSKTSNRELIMKEREETISFHFPELLLEYKSYVKRQQRYTVRFGNLLRKIQTRYNQLRGENESVVVYKIFLMTNSKLKIGLLYSFNKEWIAGAYYILNMISALKSLPHLYSEFGLVLRLFLRPP